MEYEFDAGLSKNPDHTVFHIGLPVETTEAKYSIIAASRHLLFGLRGEMLKDIWILNPEPRRQIIQDGRIKTLPY